MGRAEHSDNICPTAIQIDNDNVVVFAGGWAKDLVTTTWDGAGWSPLKSLGGVLGSSPAVTMYNDEIVLDNMGPDSTLWGLVENQ